MSRDEIIKDLIFNDCRVSSKRNDLINRYEPLVNKKLEDFIKDELKDIKDYGSINANDVLDAYSKYAISELRDNKIKDILDE
jgi:hypothetical protein